MCTIPTILIVEDNEDYLLLVQTRIKKLFNGTILTAKNGQEALEIYYRELPDYVLTDFCMPIMNGKFFLETIYKDKAVKKPRQAWLMSSENVEDTFEDFSFILKENLFNKGQLTFPMPPQDEPKYQE